MDRGRESALRNRFKVGDIEVLVVSDGEARAPGTLYFQGTTPEQWEPHKRWLDHSGNVVFPFTCFLVRSGDKNVLIDTGLGPVNMMGFTGGALIDQLAQEGVQPGDIDGVFITHLHVDHAGNVAEIDGGSARPVFPNATYRWTSEEQDYWSGPALEPSSPWPDDTKAYLKGVFAAVDQRYKPADDGAVLAPGVNVIGTPGHTPGHAGVILSSGGQRAFVLGDAISCPVQLEETEWSGLGDLDPKLARQSQETVIRELEGTEDLLAAAHFPGLTFGRVVRGDGRRYWAPL
jgi:glyoxylase-like metal-dependent hydrolase (beta-lactamase superfamily II)